MNIASIKNIVSRYVGELTGGMKEVVGAYFHGSVNWLDEAKDLPPHSDVDVVIVMRSPLSLRHGKRIHENILIDIALLGMEDFRTPEKILGNYRLAGSFVEGHILLDNDGILGELQRLTAAGYRERKWVERRCEDAFANAHRFFSGVREADPVHAQVSGCLFGRGAFAHVVLVAALKNPTVRKRYLAVRQLLEVQGGLAFYEDMLGNAGLREFTPAQVLAHLHSLKKVYAVAYAHVQPSYHFAADISAVSEQIAIGGSAELINNGYHREAMFWISAVHCRCREVLERFAPHAICREHEPAFLGLLEQLQLLHFHDRRLAVERAIAFIPRVAEQEKITMDLWISSR